MYFVPTCLYDISVLIPLVSGEVSSWDDCTLHLETLASTCIHDDCLPPSRETPPWPRPHTTTSGLQPATSIHYSIPPSRGYSMTQG